MEREFKTLSHSNYICSLLLFEDKNNLISSGGDGTKIWNFNNNDNNIYCITHFKETWCGWHGGLCKLNKERIIVSDYKTISLTVISIYKKDIIKIINHPFQFYLKNNSNKRI